MSSRPAFEQTPPDFLALPAILPPFVRKIGQQATTIGIHQALDKSFREAGITVEIDGELPPNGGLIIASDHRQRTEIPLYQIAMAQANRQPGYFLAEPTSSGGRLLQASGEHGRKTILPLLPRQAGTSARERYRVLRYPNIYNLHPSVARAVNDASLRQASQLASEGEAVGITPVQTKQEAAHHHWGNGIGRIIHQLSPEAWETAQVGILRADAFSNIRLVGALASRDLGITSKPQSIIVRTATLGTPAELFGSRPAAQSRQITNTLHQLYNRHFEERIASEE